MSSSVKPTRHGGIEPRERQPRVHTVALTQRHCVPASCGHVRLARSAWIVTAYVGQGAPRFYLAMSPELLRDPLRLRWEYAPGSELFVVYTDDYDTESRRQTTALRNRAFVSR